LSATLSWRAFELNPDLPIDGIPHEVYLSAKFGSVAACAPLGIHAVPYFVLERGYAISGAPGARDVSADFRHRRRYRRTGTGGGLTPTIIASARIIAKTARGGFVAAAVWHGSSSLP
jgi:hypothetical protein